MQKIILNLVIFQLGWIVCVVGGDFYAMAYTAIALLVHHRYVLEKNSEWQLIAIVTVVGLSDISLGLRLRHEFKREFAPYIGVEWTKKFGQTADFARDEGEDVSDTQLVLGIKAWF